MVFSTYSSNTKQHYATISGWLKKLQSFTNNDGTSNCVLIVEDSNLSHNYSFPIGDIPLNQWIYFTLTIKDEKIDEEDSPGLAGPKVSTGKGTNIIRTAGFKIEPQNQKNQETKISNHITSIEDILIAEKANNGKDVYFPLNVGISFPFYNNDTLISETITGKDVWKYKINQKRGTNVNEIYYNNCRGIILADAGALKIGYKPSANSAIVTVSVKDLVIGKRYYNGSQTYVTKTRLSKNDLSKSHQTESYRNKALYQIDTYDDYFDIFSTIANGTVTSFKKDDNNLLHLKEVYYANDQVNPIYTLEWNYDASGTMPFLIILITASCLPSATRS